MYKHPTRNNTTGESQVYSKTWTCYILFQPAIVATDMQLCHTNDPIVHNASGMNSHPCLNKATLN